MDEEGGLLDEMRQVNGLLAQINEFQAIVYRIEQWQREVWSDPGALRRRLQELGEREQAKHLALMTVTLLPYVLWDAITPGGLWTLPGF